MRRTTGGASVWVALLLSTGCTAWQYDVGTCDPSKGISDCMPLNDADGIVLSDPARCDGIWICDKATSTCKPSVRDLDGDGDLPPNCGGSDCDDKNPALSGIAGSCNCTTLRGMPCSNGYQGACLATGQWQCSITNTAVCDAPMVMGQTAWQTIKPMIPTPSWDANCDGKIEKICGEMSNKEQAPACTLRCSAEAQKLFASGSQDYNAICQAYCASISAQDCGAHAGPQYVNCAADGATVSEAAADNECGKPIVKCQCGNSLIFPFPCVRNMLAGNSPVGTVYCR